jgi:hypothetical protein
MGILKERTSMFATRPAGLVKFPKKFNDKFGYITTHNASGASLPVILPVTPEPAPEPTPEPLPTPLPADTTPPADKPCTPRPACLDANPPCSVAEPAGGYCKPDATSKDEGVETQNLHLIVYGIGAIVGATGGYLIAKNKKKSVYGGLLIGTGIVTGCVYLYFNGADLWSKVHAKTTSTEVAPKSNASGKSSPVKSPTTFPCRVEGGGATGGSGLCRCVNGVIEVQVSSAGALGWKRTEKKC